MLYYRCLKLKYADMEINYFVPYTLCQYVIKLMLRSRKYVNGFTAAFDGNLGKTAYGASAALVAMTKSIAAEHGKDGIRANCIAHGITDTHMLDSMPDYIIKYKNTVPLRRSVYRLI